MRSIINDKFYPCYLNIENFKSTVAFGWDGALVSTLPSKEDFFNHLKTVKSLASLFSEDKLYEFATRYFQYMPFIRNLFIWLDTTEDRELHDMMWKMPFQWNDYIIELFEKYRTAPSLFDKILYDTILHDLLWNCKFDPNDPRIKEINMKRISDKVYSPQRDIFTLSEASCITEILSNKECDEDSTLILDKTAYHLTLNELDADLNGIYFETLKLLKTYKEKEYAESIKIELCKLYFMNELLENKYVFNKDLSIKDREKYSTAISLRGNILQDFKFYLNYILYKENEFKFNELYMRTPYYKVFKLEREKLKNSREIINSLLNL